MIPKLGAARLKSTETGAGLEKPETIRTVLTSNSTATGTFFALAVSQGVSVRLTNGKVPAVTTLHSGVPNVSVTVKA